MKLNNTSEIMVKKKLNKNKKKLNKNKKKLNNKNFYKNK